VYSLGLNSIISAGKPTAHAAGFGGVATCLRVVSDIGKQVLAGSSQTRP
jgi:hypothetical protein